jgi:hypothetical protein
MKRIDPDALDSEDHEEKKADEPEISVDSKGAVTLKPKDTPEEKAEKVKDELKPTAPLAPIVAPAPVATKAGPPVA